MIERDITHGSRLVGVSSTQIRAHPSFPSLPTSQSPQQQSLQQPQQGQPQFHPQQQYQSQTQPIIQSQQQQSHVAQSQSRTIKAVRTIFVISHREIETLRNL